VTDLAYLGIFLAFLSGSQLLDTYVDRLRRDDCHASHGRFVHVEGQGCHFSHDVCEEPK
jgi:hypothetical protein